MAHVRDRFGIEAGYRESGGSRRVGERGAGIGLLFDWSGLCPVRHTIRGIARHGGWFLVGVSLRLPARTILARISLNLSVGELILGDCTSGMYQGGGRMGFVLSG